MDQAVMSPGSKLQRLLGIANRLLQSFRSRRNRHLFLP
jgi:hypothetical protein